MGSHLPLPGPQHLGLLSLHIFLFCLYKPAVTVVLTTSFSSIQEAQLSQRNRAMLRATECFAMSLKVTQGR